MLVWDIPTHLLMGNYTLILQEIEMTVNCAETCNQKQGEVAFSPQWSVMCQQCCTHLRCLGGCPKALSAWHLFNTARLPSWHETKTKSRKNLKNGERQQAWWCLPRSDFNWCSCTNLCQGFKLLPQISSLLSIFCLILAAIVSRYFRSTIDAPQKGYCMSLLAVPHPHQPTPTTNCIG